MHRKCLRCDGPVKVPDWICPSCKKLHMDYDLSDWCGPAHTAPLDFSWHEQYESDPVRPRLFPVKPGLDSKALSKNIRDMNRDINRREQAIDDYRANGQKTGPRNGQQRKRSKRKPGWMRGELHWRAKLTKRQVLEIRALHRKLEYRKIAAMYGISVKTVGHIIGRRRWAHI